MLKGGLRLKQVFNQKYFQRAQKGVLIAVTNGRNSVKKAAKNTSMTV
tara:strand:- start:22962 stop:23102 length:141 start_codon:yes stop_codon:yes gene_type:complete